MSCGKKPLKKSWQCSRTMRVVSTSKYQQNDPSVKKYWRNVVEDLEKTYKDEKFWESSASTVRDIVGPSLFKRIANIANIPQEQHVYVARSEELIPPSYSKYPSVVRLSTNQVNQVSPKASRLAAHSSFVSTTDEGSGSYSSSEVSSTATGTKTGTTTYEGSSQTSESILAQYNTQSKLISKSFVKSTFTIKSAKSLTRSSMSRKMSRVPFDEPASSQDDLEVHYGGVQPSRKKREKGNPFYDMLYCNDNELDMINWKSNFYEKQEFKVSASDKFSKKAEILTKKIAKDFYDWWDALEADEFQSEIHRPADIEDLFQIMFNEHASRGLVINPKLLPCVLTHVAKREKAPEAACPASLDRHVEWDIRAEKRPTFERAFGTSLPRDIVHKTPNNNTAEQWRSLKIPEDLRTMSCVWDDIMHLTSTKSFKEYLKQNRLSMPECLSKQSDVKSNKMPVLIPSDLICVPPREESIHSDISLPISELTIQLQDVIDNLMNDNS